MRGRSRVIRTYSESYATSGALADTSSRRERGGQAQFFGGPEQDRKQIRWGQSKYVGDKVTLTAIVARHRDPNRCRDACWSDCTRTCIGQPEASCSDGYFPFLSWSWHPLASRRDASIPRRRLTLR